VPERGSAFTKYLDPASLRSPMVAVEAVRRTVERALETLCVATATGLEGATAGAIVRPTIDAATLVQASDGVRAASDFLSKSDAPPSDEGHAWFTSTVHALDHANRLAEAVDAMAKTGVATDGPDEISAAALCAQSMRDAAGAAANLAVASGPGHGTHDELAQTIAGANTSVAARPEAGKDAAQSLARATKALADIRAQHRSATLDMVASGKVTASQAMARVDAVALMSRLAHHAWRAIAHLERAAAARMEIEQ
jgi:phosphate:Na+ symporter